MSSMRKTCILGKATKGNRFARTTVQRTDLSQHFRLGISPRTKILPAYQKSEQHQVEENNDGIYVSTTAANDAKYTP